MDDAWQPIETMARNPKYAEHWALFDRRTILPTDYADYGGEVVRWEHGDKAYPDCSCGCVWARWLSGRHAGDWLICAKQDGPRFGLLTFEHQAGAVCFEAKRRKRPLPPPPSDADAE